MQSSFGSTKKPSKGPKKYLLLGLFFILISSAIFAPVNKAQAILVHDIPKAIWDEVTKVAKKLWTKGGSLAFQQTLRTALNTMAYDTANWIGSGGEGQKPLFVTQDWGAYMAQVGDEAAGTFLENFTANWSETRAGGSGMTLNYCQPSSIDVKLRIAMGLSQQQRPQGPSCTASQMIGNWTSAAKKYSDYKDPNFLNKFVNVFDPVSSDMGIFWEASQDMMAEKKEGELKTERLLLGQGGWLDPRGPDGSSLALPGQSQMQIEAEYEKFSANFSKHTGDAFIDAANIFLNQLALSSFNKLMQNIGKKTGGTSSGGVAGSDSYEADPSAPGGEIALKENTVKLVQASFGVKSNYSILSELSICPDPQNPGPSNCVMDSSFMQAVSEQKTVAEAMADGYLNPSWQFEINSLPGSYQNSYSWRNISILRKYRIVPASWELVFEKMQRYNNAVDLAREEDKDLNLEKKQATLQDLVSCFSPYDEYNEFTSQFDASDQAWCTGLVDPNWVLKSPLNNCQKEGVSPQILNKYVVPSQPAYGENPYIPSSLTITRANNYCADSQTCISEARDGSCLAYGYCNEEKRTWSFDSEVCEPIDNTCQAFVSPKSGEKIAYLENTLDYEGCTTDNAGCMQYSTYGSYNSLNGAVNWNANNSIYLNENLSECSSSDEGCSEIIRVKAAWGANLVMNSSFINDNIGDQNESGRLNDWPIDASYAEIVESSSEPGGDYGKAIKLESSGSASLYSNVNNSLLPQGLDLIPGQAYTLSADIYLDSGDSVAISLGDSDTSSKYETKSKGVWRHVNVTKVAGDSFSSPSFSISGKGAQVVLYIKNIKLEMGSWDTGFKYYASNRNYQKVLPEYLESTCYVGETANGYSYELKANAPSQCNNYARRCDQGEVGCELYTNVSNGVYKIPAKVSSTDYCDAKCVGYDVYVARESNFFSSAAENLIPKTAEACSAESVGCTEFTNLDSLQTGGESKEYYSALKYCVKPGQAQCSNFYAWEKTESGSQLKLYTLKAEPSGEPSTISDDSASCNAQIFNASVSSPDYNADCQEFYNTAGDISYHLNSQVITCSDDCRSYRMTEKNYDNTLSQAECRGSDMNWDNQAGACVSCVNGGTWSSEHNACLYQGIPGEGKTCSASANSCREYNGSAGNNVRLVSSHDFENTSPLWTSNCSNGISLADISNDKSGKSLLYNSSATSCADIGTDRQALSAKPPLIKSIIAGDNTAAQLKLGHSLAEGKSYNIKFWASSPTGASLKAYIYNPETGERSDFNSAKELSIKSGGTWQTYSLNLEELDHKVGPNEVLVITASNNFYLDNFILTEITDRYYLIKGSSKIPDICYYDIFDNYQGADYNLGCSAYKDRNGIGHNLHNFSDLCSSSSVGCEQVISTENYTPYGPGIWGDTNGNEVCDSDEDDCISVDGDKAMYLVYDVSKQCTGDNMGCSRLGEAVSGSNATEWSDVFKKNQPNEYDKTLCEKSSVGCSKWPLADGSGYSYFRDPGSNACVYRSGSASGAGQKAWYKTGVSGDELCEVSYLKTIGYGNRVPVPSKNAGICSPQASTCTEYIDPQSNFNPDLLNTSSANKVELKANTLYILSAKDSKARSIARSTLRFDGGARAARLQNDNTFATSTNLIYIEGANISTIFNSQNAKSATFNGNKDNVSLRELAIAYQIASEVDKASCNGRVDEGSGCVLFNERAMAGESGYSALTNGFDPYLSENAKAPTVCRSSIAGSCAANKLIKVRPDRVCATWLSCSTYGIDEATGKQVCYDLKQCNALGENGACVNFLADDYRPNEANATGYYILGQDSISQMKEVGLNSNAHFDFEEMVPSLSCLRKGNEGTPCTYDENIVKDFVVREPDKARVDYPASGKSYLRVPSAYKLSPQAHRSYINLSPSQTYYISYLVNTKNSGGDAFIEIRDGDKRDGALEFYSQAPNGWERKVHEFRTRDDTYDRVMIFLSSTGGEEGEVYFDDINIEPVLQVSEDRFSSRDCRLYPNTDSYGCNDYNKNVASSGLEGYCLEYDRNNPSVCLTWYPVDRISSSLGGTALGYNGVNGLSYCTNINSNIKFAKKVKTKFVYSNEDRSAGYFVRGTNNTCSTNPSSTDPYLPYNPNCEEIAGNQGVVRVNRDMCTEVSNITYCGSADYRAILVNDKIHYNNEFIYCVPNENSPNFLFGVGGKTSASLLPFAVGLDDGNGCDRYTFYNEAWFEYHSYMHQHPVVRCEDAGAGKCEPINEYENADPPIRIYNPDYPAFDEQGLKFIAADKGDRDKVFNFTCSEFTQMVSSSGDNKAWVTRVSSAVDPRFNYETPTFFSNSTSANLNKYGRQRMGIPYGAATFDASYDLLNSGPVYLQNQYYQKDDNKVFAGRPYGCSGESCANVGYCSNNPNVLCVHDPSGSLGNYINAKSCSDGGFGVCTSLWTANQEGRGVYAKNVLGNIFKQSYGTFTFRDGNYVPGTGDGILNTTATKAPGISNAKLIRGIREYRELSSTERVSGVYALQFNTTIDPDSQPLNMIHIDWGDGDQQAITGTDHRPDVNNQHTFYHYYSKADLGKKIIIQVWDNWDQRSSFSFSPGN